MVTRWIRTSVSFLLIMATVFAFGIKAASPNFETDTEMSEDSSDDEPPGTRPLSREEVTVVTEVSTETMTDDVVFKTKTTTAISEGEEAVGVVKKISIKTLYSKKDIEDIAKVLYLECRGAPSETQRACVVWCILNRVDDRESTIYQVITAKHQFAYRENTPLREDLVLLAEDVLERWAREKQGEVDVGRVLPKDYEYFVDDYKGGNIFRNKYSGDYTIWDHSLESPYDS